MTTSQYHHLSCDQNQLFSHLSKSISSSPSLFILPLLFHHCHDYHDYHDHWLPSLIHWVSTSAGNQFPSACMPTVFSVIILWLEEYHWGQWSWWSSSWSWGWRTIGIREFFCFHHRLHNLTLLWQWTRFTIYSTISLLSEFLSHYPKKKINIQQFFLNSYSKLFKLLAQWVALVCLVALVGLVGLVGLADVLTVLACSPWSPKTLALLFFANWAIASTEFCELVDNQAHIFTFHRLLNIGPQCPWGKFKDKLHLGQYITVLGLFQY